MYGTQFYLVSHHTAEPSNNKSRKNSWQLLFITFMYSTIGMDFRRNTSKNFSSMSKELYL
jgi:hypothetical protein